ncbi:MAG: dipeptidase [Vicinamibacterales bacterium]
MSSAPETAPSVHARTLHGRALVWDAHCDSLQRVVVNGVDLGLPSGAQADLPAWEAGGVNAQVFAVWVDTIYGAEHAARRALEQIAAFHQFLAAYPDRVALAMSAADVTRIVGSGRLAAMLAIEGGLAIQNDLALLRTYARLGATSMTLTHSSSIDWVDSSTDVERWGGLNDLGRAVIDELNRLRMVVDVSHVSDKAAEQAAALSKAPVIASHSSARALSDHPRNVSDRLARIIADTGGCIGVNCYNEFIDERYRDTMASRSGGVLQALNRPTTYRPHELDRAAADRLAHLLDDVPFRPPFERILDHIDHLVRVAGIDHVGLGADLDACVIPTPEGLDSVRDYPKITAGLVRRGYADADIEKILGRNFLRVFGDVRGA